VPENEQEVPDDSASHGRFDQRDQAMVKGHGAEDDFRQIAERGIEQPADLGADSRGQVFRGRTDKARKHDHGQAGTNKESDIIFEGRHIVDENRYRDKNDEPVDVGFEHRFHFSLLRFDEFGSPSYMDFIPWVAGSGFRTSW
jgi:hypothetical protein